MPSSVDARLGHTDDRSPELRAALERLPAAVRELLKRGLATVGFDAAPAGTRAHQFGVIGPDGAEGEGYQVAARCCFWMVPGARLGRSTQDG